MSTLAYKTKLPEDFPILIDNLLLLLEKVGTGSGARYSVDPHTYEKFLKAGCSDWSDLYTPKKVQAILKQVKECHLRRFSKAKFDITKFKRIKTASLDPEQSSDKKLINDLDQLNVAVDIVRSDLKGRNSGQYAELYLLIEQLGYMYKTCSNSNKKPSVTESDYPDKKGRGVFFALVTSIVQKVFNKKVALKTWDEDKQSIKPYTIIEGIRFLK